MVGQASVHPVDLLISGEEEPIGTTDNHPFWTEDRREYVPAGELRVGENLRTVNGSRTYVQSIRPRGPPEDVYNLEVEGAHTYHVGTTGVLVHNSCAPNPYGKKGGPAHQAKVNEIFDDIERRGLEPITEYRFDTPNGAKSKRFADVVAQDPNTKRIVEVHQVGRVLKSNPGIPVARERAALSDISSVVQSIVTQLFFHAY